jgi:hypothetical protein
MTDLLRVVGTNDINVFLKILSFRVLLDITFTFESRGRCEPDILEITIHVITIECEPGDTIVVCDEKSKRDRM